MARNNDDHCPLCGDLMEVRVLGFHSTPFVDGRKYDAICFPCSDVPKTTWDEHSTRGFLDPNCLHTVEEMISDGWSREEAKRSLKAVQRAIRTSPSLYQIESALGVNVLEQLYLPDEPLVFTS